VPIVPLDVSDADALEIAIIENVQREDLNAMEEAQGYPRSRTNSNAARKTSPRSWQEPQHVANMMRLTKTAIGSSGLYRQRRTIRRPCPRPDRRARPADGRQAHRRRRPQRAPDQALAHEEGVPERKPQKARSSWRGRSRSGHDRAGKRVSDALGLAVTVNHRRSRGSVVISYRNLEQA